MTYVLTKWNKRIFWKKLANSYFLIRISVENRQNGRSSKTMFFVQLLIYTFYSNNLLLVQFGFFIAFYQHDLSPLPPPISNTLPSKRKLQHMAGNPISDYSLRLRNSRSTFSKNYLHTMSNAVNTRSWTTVAKKYRVRTSYLPTTLKCQNQWPTVGTLKSTTF